MGLLNSKKERSWKINTADGEHNIILILGKSTREPMELFLDKRRVETIQYATAGLVPHMEYNFSCGDETLTLVVHGNNVDLVYKGVLVNNKIEYKPKEILPLAYRVVAILVSIAAVSLIWLLRPILGAPSSSFAYVIALAMIGASTLLVYNQSTNPFVTKKKKYLLSLLFVLWSWIITALVLVFLGNVAIFL